MHIPFPDKTAEFEMQAGIFNALAKAGYKVRGEVKAKFGSGKCSFDLVIFQGKTPRLIIEVKNSLYEDRARFRLTRQGIRYPQFGFPVFLITSSDFDSFLAVVEKQEVFFPEHQSKFQI